MAIKNDLLAEIRATLGASIAPSLSSASAVSDIFEAYVLSLVIQAAEAEDATITYKDVFGNVPTSFPHQPWLHILNSTRLHTCHYHIPE